MMSSRTKFVLGILIVASAGMGTWALWPRTPKPPATQAAAKKRHSGVSRPASGAAESIRTVTPASAAATQGSGVNPILQQIRPENNLDNAAAAACYQKGKQLFADKKLIASRTELSKALASGKLTTDQEQDTVKMLSDLAADIIFSRKIADGDPYAMQYLIQPGEKLEGVNGIERKYSLRVPSQLILRINNVPRAADLQAGQVVKLFKGPFHAIVTKSKYTMDVYLDDAFVRRYKVCIGAADTPSPEGFFHVTLRGKLSGNTPYTPPLSSGLPAKKIMPGEPGYPLDAGGHWISLTGIAEKGTNIPETAGYGIHGTNDPGSIGKMASHGCIRLGDKDIEEVFMLLYEKWSTVEIRP